MGPVGRAKNRQAGGVWRNRLQHRSPSEAEPKIGARRPFSHCERGFEVSEQLPDGKIPERNGDQ
jgi:hypothetical protein